MMRNNKEIYFSKTKIAIGLANVKEKRKSTQVFQFFFAIYYKKKKKQNTSSKSVCFKKSSGLKSTYFLITEKATTCGMSRTYFIQD